MSLEIIPAVIEPAKILPISFEVSTFGCKVNTYDSGLIEKRLQEHNNFQIYHTKENDTGISSSALTKPQVYILNSCAVTAEATKEVLKSARRIKRDHPEALLVVTGCSAQVDTEKLEFASEIDLVVANSHKTEIEQLILKKIKGEPVNKIHKSNIFKKEELEMGGGLEEAHTRAYLKIQDGCNSFCTFCVIPFARGKSRSIPIENLRQRVNELLSQGIREIVLTGVHIGDYEFGLENLIEDLLLKTRVPRLRLTSLEPIELNERMFELFEDPRLCPHFHMSIQSASTRILHRMKRKYTAEQVEKALNDISERVPQAFVGMDVIVGFPGENEAEFLQTYSLLSRAPWTRIHVFPYSERPSTYAVRLDEKIDKITIDRYADRLRQLSHERVIAAARKQLGQQKKTLVLKNNRGLSRDYWPIEMSGDSELLSGLFNSEIKTIISDFRIRSNGEPILKSVIDAQPTRC